jgi:hypothetical protein
MEFVNINKKPRPEFHCNKEVQGKLGQVFLVENLFSELKTKTQRDKARKNLGISETVHWDNIVGIPDDIFNDTIVDSPTVSAPSTSTSIYWRDIKGTPEVESPDEDDDSNRIATTAWVKN